MAVPDSARVTCIEVGGGSVETIVLGGPAPVSVPGAHPLPGIPLLMAVPGLIAGGRVVAASNLGWYDVDPARELGLDVPADLVINDAEAAALGESALRDGRDLTYVGLGTGVGGAVVRAGALVAANLLGHAGWFGPEVCVCGRTGCLETVAAGWALPHHPDEARLGAVAAAVATGVRDEQLADTTLVVVAGGLARRHPAVVDAVAAALPDRVVEPSAAPQGVKSAAAWGLALVYDAQTTGMRSGVLR